MPSYRVSCVRHWNEACGCNRCVIRAHEEQVRVARGTSRRRPARSNAPGEERWAILQAEPEAKAPPSQPRRWRCDCGRLNVKTSCACGYVPAWAKP